MKIRSGFVSNSSSASFVLLGFSMGDFDTEVLHSEDGFCEYDHIYEGEGGAPDGEGVVVGKFLAESSDNGYMDTEVFDLLPIMEEVEALKKEFGADTPTRFYTGTRLC